MTMKYAAKKIGLMLLTMVIVSFLAFLAFQVIPGDPAVKLLGTEATPGAALPPCGRKWDWTGRFLSGMSSGCWGP